MSARLTPKMQDRLLEHIDGPRPYVAGRHIATLECLVIRGMISFTPDRRFTIARPLGHQTAASILGSRADQAAPVA